MTTGASSLVPLTAGRLRAHVVDRRSTLLLETASGSAAAVVDLEPDGGAAILTAADGSWSVHEIEGIPRHRKPHLSVRDASGAEAATVWHEGAEKRIELPSETLVWKSPSLSRLRLWNYTIDGLFLARPSPWTFGARRPSLLRRPFTVEIGDTLAARPDASLVALLASWLTYVKVRESPA